MRKTVPAHPQVALSLNGIPWRDHAFTSADGAPYELDGIYAVGRRASCVFAQIPQLGIAIWMVNLINGAFGFWQEYRAEQATAATAAAIG